MADPLPPPPPPPPPVQPEPPLPGNPSGMVSIRGPGWAGYDGLGIPMNTNPGQEWGFVDVAIDMLNGVIQNVWIFLSGSEDRFLTHEIIYYWGTWMVERNSVELDIVAGATGTSIGVLDAAREAVRQIIAGPRLTLNTPILTLPVDGEGELVATLTVSQQALTWSSSDTDVATVNQQGGVTAVSAGWSVITVTDGAGLYATAVVFVH